MIGDHRGEVEDYRSHSQKIQDDYDSIEDLNTQIQELTYTKTENFEKQCNQFTTISF